MKNIKFRPATEKDIETLYRVKIAAFSDEFEEFKYAEADEIFKKIVEDSKSDNPKEGMFLMDWHKSFIDFTFVIENEAEIIGSIVIVPGEPFGGDYPGYDAIRSDTNVLLCMYVLPKYKNKGIGAAAVQYAEQVKPAKRWILSTPDVSVKNKHFYEKCGYSVGTSYGPNDILRTFTKGF